ncbi:MAG: hypothetical protein NXI08_01105 [bacterium]|jgi:uncharacterized protein involved in exopolysaccharide biosynthesis|nr:hypothetical protein [bacterium]
MQEKEYKNSLYSFIGLILAYKKLFIIVFIISSISAVGVSLLLPNWYRSSTTLVPPKGTDLLSLLNAGSGGGALQKIAGIGLGGAFQNLGAYNYLAILDSRELKEQIIQEFDLITFYEMEDEPWEKVLKAFNEYYSFDFNNEGYLTISYEDKDPVRSTQVTKRVVELLNNYSNELAVSEASANREFLEVKIIEVQDSLDKIEQRYSDFFEDEEFIFIPENVNTAENISQVYARKKISEIEYELLKNRLGADNQQLIVKEQEIALLEREIQNFPQSVIESIKIYREYLVLTSMLEYLIPALEQAKLELVKNTPIILVLDEAKVPEYKSRPKRSIICIVSVLLALLTTFGVILLKEKIDFDEIRRSQNDYQ